jgi:hypothetical protein
MKTPVLSTLLLGMTIVAMGFGQRPHQLTAHPSCRQLFEQCARALPGPFFNQWRNTPGWECVYDRFAFWG